MKQISRTCSCQVLVLPIRYMLVCLGVAVLFRKAEIDDVDLVGFLAEPHEEVVGLDISVNETLGMHEFHSTADTHTTNLPLATQPRLKDSKSINLARNLSITTMHKYVPIYKYHGVITRCAWVFTPCTPSCSAGIPSPTQQEYSRSAPQSKYSHCTIRI